MLAGDPTEAAEKAEEFLKEKSLSSYFDEVALKGLLLAQADAKRGALDQARMTKIRDAVTEFASELSTQEDLIPEVTSPTLDAEAAAAVETVPDTAISSNLPMVQKADLPLDWQGEHPVLCLAGRTSLDEAAAYVGHRVLGPRLVECTRTVAESEERAAEQIFGGIDAQKLHSSMTLFARVAPDVTEFDEYFAGASDPATIALL